MTNTSLFKRGFTAFLAMLVCLSSFIGLGSTTAYAAGEQAEVYGKPLSVNVIPVLTM